MKYTVYAVARANRRFTSDQGIPYVHAATEAKAKEWARRLAAGQDCHPTRIVERQAEYPFTPTRTLWRCDGS